MAEATISWSETFARLRQDRARIRDAMAPGPNGMRSRVRVRPSYVCVMLHRVAHKLYVGGHFFLSRLLWILNVVLTGADISLGFDAEGGLLIVSPAGVALVGKAGRNLTVMPLAGTGGETGRREDVGAGPGLPVLGDDVVLGPRVGVLGPVRIGHRVRAEAGSIVTVDVPDDTLIAAPRVRFLNKGVTA